MYSDIDRKFLIVPWTVFAGALTIAGSETTKDEICIFVAPTNGVIVGWSASYVNELTTDETVTENTDLAIAISRGDRLNIKGDANNTDNAFDGLVITLYWQPLANI